MRKPTFKYYRKKTAELLKKEFKYLLTGFFVLSAIGTFAFIQFQNKNILGVFTFDSSEDSPIAVSDKTEDVLQVLSNKDINYVSPSVDIENPKSGKSGISRPDENGQISAISSGRVTDTSDAYVVQPGDTLASIAEKVYGDANAWVRIAFENGIENIDSIEVGMTLQIPR